MQESAFLQPTAVPQKRHLGFSFSGGVVRAAGFTKSFFFKSATNVELGVDTVEAAFGVVNISCSASACKCSANSITVVAVGVVSRPSTCRMPATRKVICVPPALQRVSDHFDSKPISSSGSGSCTPSSDALPRFRLHVLSVVRISLTPALADSLFSLSSLRSTVLSWAPPG